MTKQTNRRLQGKHHCVIVLKNDDVLGLIYWPLCSPCVSLSLSWLTRTYSDCYRESAKHETDHACEE